MADTNDDMNLFDSVISGDKSASTQLEPEITTQEPVRDEAGKFAKVETPATEQPVTTQAVEEGPVPVAAVQDERRKRQDAEKRLAEMEARHAALEARMNTPAPVQQVQQPQAPASIWDDPDAFIAGQLTPIEQRLAAMQETIMEGQASQVHGADKLAAAKEAASALFGKPEGVRLHQELMQGGNPFSNLVKWHERQQVLAMVGNDPEAFRAAEREKLLADPTFLAQAMERAKTNSQSNGNGRTTPPRTSLPTLSNIAATGGGNAAAEQPSDGNLFSSITSARRK